MAVPPGLSEQEFSRALQRFARVVGNPWVFTSDEDVALYRDAYTPLWNEDEEKVASAAHASDAATLERGKAVFEEWCRGCHAPGPRNPGTQALDVLYKGKKPGALEERTDLDPKLTMTFVRRGVSVMPPFRKTEISDEDLAALAAYLAPRKP